MPTDPGAENDEQEERARGIERPDAPVKFPSGNDDDEGADGDQPRAQGRVRGYVMAQQPVTVDFVHAAASAPENEQPGMNGSIPDFRAG
ncbi:hypothetical protein HNQ96_000151 [Aminobacter lissarensis]|uniref:Uncharacterized protein n=1 Tax=Aminobacter carboxidus TaxID=376165 RepID=A0A8E2BAR1_9HYPH|nr:hypothetical protein [Aminobacter lissarensis]MBB6464304.1 hypothetical protein [Aminobacter lissarensis]